MNIFIRLNLTDAVLWLKEFLSNYSEAFCEIQKEWNFCLKISEAHQDLTHQQSVNFCDSDKSCFSFCPVYWQEDNLQPKFSHCQQLPRKEKTLFQDWWQYCFYYNVHKCRKVLHHNGEWEFSSQKSWRIKAAKHLRCYLTHKIPRVSYRPNFAWQRNFIPFENPWIFPKWCKKKK